MKTRLACIALIALTGTASADNKERADALFRQGKKLMAEKRYADACESFQKSMKLDPGIGTQLNVALCFEEWGKLGVAYRAYQKAEDMAKDAHDSRAGKIEERIEQLEPEVPKLTIKLPKDADTTGLKITIDGAPLDVSSLGDVQRVDPGPHVIDYTVPGEKKKSKLVPVERGANTEITLDVPAKKVDKEPVDKPVVVAPPPVDDPGKTQRIAAYAVAGAGGAAVVVSSVLALGARSKYNDALAQHCGGMTNGCDMQGLTDTHDARHTANIATFVFLGGLAAVGGGVALYLTAPHAAPSDEHAFYLAPTFTGDGGGVVIGGRL